MRSLLLNVNSLKIANYFTDDFRQPRTARIFFQGLVLYTFVKILFLWKISAAMVQYHNLPSPGSLFGKILLLPTILAERNIDGFYAAALVILALAFVLKPYYIIRLLFAYITFNLYVINLPLSNGSGIVLFMLSIWCILMGRYPSITIKGYDDVQKMIFNLGLVLCQLQIVNVYLVSGLDKLLSRTWRSGEAFAYVRHLDYYYNPVLPNVLDGSTWNLILSWCTILFELLFVVFVWSKRTRLPILAIGVVFNLFIWIVLSIPDFALLMTLSFVIFLRDDDFKKLKKRIRL